MKEVSGNDWLSTPEPFIVPVYGPFCAAVIKVPLYTGGEELLGDCTKVTVYVPFAHAMLSESVIVAVTDDVWALLDGDKDIITASSKAHFISTVRITLLLLLLN
jgi:hypothetical protein